MAAVVLVLATALEARAEDRIYWADALQHTISYASLGGGASTVLSTGAATPVYPAAIAVDPTSNSLYWTNSGTEGSIFRTNLDGSGEAAEVETNGLAATTPFGLAVDSSANSIYWTNYQQPRVSRANLDGTGDAADLDTTGATVRFPSAMVIEPDSNTLYWTNLFDVGISRMDLDTPGSASSFISTPAAGSALGLAVDPEGGAIYWSNTGQNQIWRANLDGSAASVLDTAGAEVALPTALAIDPETNSIYWANVGGTIARADLDGGGHGSNLSITAAGIGYGLALLKSPIPLDPPTVSGDGSIGEELTCAPATWAGDLPSGSLYRAPASFAHRWLRDGDEIPGETGLTYTPGAPGSYSCRAIASNEAGSSEQTSDSLAVTGTSAFSITPGSLAFGWWEVAAGPTAVRSFVVTNPGKLALHVASVSIQGSGAAQFAITHNSCGVPVAPLGGTCSVEVVFDPSSTGEMLARLRFEHDARGSPASFELAGIGTNEEGPPPSDPGVIRRASGSGPEVDSPPLARASATGALATVLASVLLADSRGWVPIAVSCAGARPCSGTLRVQTVKRVRVRPGKRKRVILASRRFTGIPPFATGTVRLRLGARARRLVERLGSVDVAITVTTTSPGTSAAQRTVGKATLHARSARLRS